MKAKNINKHYYLDVFSYKNNVFHRFFYTFYLKIDFILYIY